jgi:hypothetical protein
MVGLPLEIVGCASHPKDVTLERIAAVVATPGRGAELTPRGRGHGEAEWLRERHAGETSSPGFREIRDTGSSGNDNTTASPRPEAVSGIGFDPDEVLPMATPGVLRRGPLQKCVHVGRTDMVEMLLAHGATLMPRPPPF